ncbi:MAG: hypothetical protein QG594_1931 [Bacteroidota bacterium]|nr:hypothetical protein [Bacteroidota bacterium]
MKKITTLIVFLIFNTLMFSQEKDSLLIVGKWKVVSIETHNYKYNSLTDSFSWSEDFEKILPKLIKDTIFKNAEEAIEDTKKKTLGDTFIFQNDGVYFRKQGNQTLRKGIYNIDFSEKIIHFKDKDKPEYSMEYFFNEGFLYLNIKFGTVKINSKPPTLKPTKFILKRTQESE